TRCRTAVDGVNTNLIALAIAAAVQRNREAREAEKSNILHILEGLRNLKASRAPSLKLRLPQVVSSEAARTSALVRRD
ncbi:MAG: hypothetical protein ACO32I_08830, partial [Candidatus Limnocylindrus sp.]